MLGHMACKVHRRAAHRILEGKPEGNKPLGRCRYRWEGNSNVGLAEISVEVAD